MLLRALMLLGLERLFPDLLGQLGAVSAGEEGAVLIAFRSLLCMGPYDRLPREIGLFSRIGQYPASPPRRLAMLNRHSLMASLK